MTLLAENPRTAIKATIKRASAQARRDMRSLDRTMQAQVEAIYKRAAQDLEQIIDGYAGSDGSVRLEVMQDLLDQVNRSLASMATERNQLIDDALAQSAQIGVNPYTQTGQFVTRAAEDALNFVVNFVHEDDLQLSDRLWRLDNGARQMVGNAIQSAVIQGKSASQAATDFLSRGVEVPPDVAAKMGMNQAGRIIRATGAQLLRADGNPREAALRVFRTEMNRAHGEAYMLGGEDHPDFGGWRFLLSPRHPRTDICDMHASVNRYGLGRGVYPSRERCPWPAHPNTLSFVEIVFKDELDPKDERRKQDRISWIKDQPPNIQEAVLNGRKKRAALQQGILVENEIATPWRVLKRRYEGRGIDIQALVPKSEVTFRDLPIENIRSEAYEYVTDKGISTGFEHAVAYDVKTRTEYIRKTSRAKSSVSFDRHEMTIFSDPRNKLEIVHNHPSSSSLSAPDLNMATLPGIDKIIAVGHDGTIYSARVLTNTEQLRRAIREIEDMTYSVIKPLVNAGGISINQAQRLHAHIINTTLHKLGLINYKMSNDRGAFAAASKGLDPEFVDKITNEFVERY